MSGNQVWHVFAVAILSIVITPSAFGQTAQVTGSVKDASGARVPGAAVIVTNIATGIKWEAVSNEAGYYSLPLLPPGRYEVAVEKAGFTPVREEGLTVQVQQVARLDFTLQVGDVRQSVDVVAPMVLLDSSSAAMGQVVENRRLQDLPLNGRSALALTLLTAGVVSMAGPTNSGFGDRGIFISSISINGGPSSMNAQMLDGNNNALAYIGEVGVPPSVDAVEEFKVQSGTVAAEFGFTAGGAVNLVTKSGTNDIHGTAYEFLRNDAVDARNTFAAAKQALRYNQFGGSAGGPFIKNRTFGFVNLEEYRLRQGTPRILSTPVPEFREGDFRLLRTNTGTMIPIHDPATTRANPNGSGLVRDLFPNNIIPKNRFDPITPGILAFWPLPNRTPSNPYTFSENFYSEARSRVNWTQVHVKADHRFTDANSMFFRYTHVRHAQYLPGNDFITEKTAAYARDDDQTNRNVMFSDTHTFSPSVINELRVGLVRQAFTFTAVSANRNWPSKLGLPPTVPQDEFPNMNFGFGQIGGYALGTRASLSWDIKDMVTKVTGAHTIKIGFNLGLLQGGNAQATVPSGNFTFTGLTQNPQRTAGTGDTLAQFLLGDVSSAYCERYLGSLSRWYTLTGFVQDDWKIRPRLTLNLGLRWDFQKKPEEMNNGAINFDMATSDPQSGLMGRTVFAGVDGQPRSFLKEDYTDFSPRVGFAWDIFGGGKTVFRGGYGIYYPPLNRRFFGSNQLFSLTTTSYSAAGPGLPAFRFSHGFPYAPLESPGAAAGSGALLGQSVRIQESNGVTPLTQQWNASLQHRIGAWVVDAGYVANKGNHLVAGDYDLNQLDPKLRLQLGQALSTPVPNPNAGKITGGLGAATIPRERSLMAFPHYTSVLVALPPIGNYISHQFQLTVKRPMARGLLVNFSYAAGKKISDGQIVPVDFGGVEQLGANGFQNGLYDRRANRSIDPADVSQRGVISVLYELPFGPGKRFIVGNAIARKLAGGWQVNTIGVMQSGQPIVVTGASNFQANRPNSTGQSARLDNPTQTRWFNTDVFVNPPNYTFGNIGRVLPDVRSPSAVNFDLSLLKNTRLSERFNLQLRVEAFNVSNRVNLIRPNGSFVAGADGKNSGASFGRISSARDARVMQVALKLIF